MATDYTDAGLQDLEKLITSYKEKLSIMKQSCAPASAPESGPEVIKKRSKALKRRVQIEPSEPEVSVPEPTPPKLENPVPKLETKSRKKKEVTPTSTPEQPRVHESSSAKKIVGTYEEVYNGTADRTKTGKVKSDLTLSRTGKVITKLQLETGQKAYKNMLERMRSNAAAAVGSSS